MESLPWALIVGLGLTGVLMGLVSCLVGMRPKVENPAWWGLYAIWIAIVLFVDRSAPFITILIASGMAGLLHGTTTALLLDQYRDNNPWHAEKTQGSRGTLAAYFIGMGLVIGIAFGTVVGGVAWGLSRVWS
ncbi:MAG: hypothetical protein ACE5FP_07835 [Gemmatimonadota bacterium]